MKDFVNIREKPSKQINFENRTPFRFENLEMKPIKPMKSYRLSKETIELLESLSYQSGFSMTEILQKAIKDFAESRK